MRRGRPGSLFAKGLVPTDDVSPGLSPFLGTSRTADRSTLLGLRARCCWCNLIVLRFFAAKRKTGRCPKRDRVEGLRLRETDRKRERDRVEAENAMGAICEGSLGPAPRRAALH